MIFPSFEMSEDIHLATARAIFGVESPTREQRAFGKSVNFARPLPRQLLDFNYGALEEAAIARMLLEGEISHQASVRRPSISLALGPLLSPEFLNFRSNLEGQTYTLGPASLAGRGVKTDPGRLSAWYRMKRREAQIQHFRALYGPKKTGNDPSKD